MNTGPLDSLFASWPFSGTEGSAAVLLIGLGLGLRVRRSVRVASAAGGVAIFAATALRIWLDLHGKNPVLAYVMLAFVGPFVGCGTGYLVRAAWRGTQCRAKPTGSPR